MPRQLRVQNVVGRPPQSVLDVRLVMTSILPLSGLSFPEFRTLLIQGEFHASAPIHFCISHVLAHDVAKALLVAPSRARFSSSLTGFNDEWLMKHGGEGRVIRATAKVDIQCVSLVPVNESYSLIVLC